MIPYDPLGDGISRLELIDFMGTDYSAIRAARVSYGRDTGLEPHPDHLSAKDANLIRSLLERGHFGVFEHAYLTVMVKCPIFIARQWLRHRSHAFNELSRRYVDDEREPLEFYIPPPDAWRTQHPTEKQASVALADTDDHATYCTDEVRDNCAAATWRYRSLLRSGVAREQARMVLPVNLYTRFYDTMSLRSALHFIAERAAPTAQYEIQLYAKALGEIVANLWPVTWAAWQRMREVPL